MTAYRPHPTASYAAQALPAILGWAEVFREQRLFSVCGDRAWNCEYAELEANIVAHLSETAPAAVAAETRAHTDYDPRPRPLGSRRRRRHGRTRWFNPLDQRRGPDQVVDPLWFRLFAAMVH